MCGYKPATNWQNFTEKHLAYAKILQKVLVGFFDSHCMFCVNEILTKFGVQLWRNFLDKNCGQCFNLLYKTRIVKRWSGCIETFDLSRVVELCTAP